MTRRMEHGEPSARSSSSPVEHLDHGQLDRLAQAFDLWHEKAPSVYIRRVRGRYRLAFLFLRFSGARIGEVLRIDDSTDIDFKQSEIKIVRADSQSLRRVVRVVPVPRDVSLEVLNYLSEFPRMRGKVFALDQGNFRREFYRRAEEAEIPRELSYPHILRHTRAIEMLRAGVPLTTVRDLLGHALSGTTAIYLQHSELAARRILRDKGLL